MSDFAGDVRRFLLRLRADQNVVFVDACAMVEESIQIGSPITGSPGQPVKSGVLRDSWQLTFESDTVAVVSSGGPAAPYNRPIEDGVGKYGPLKLRSSVGGFHSVAQTVAGWPRIVAAALAKRNASGASPA